MSYDPTEYVQRARVTKAAPPKPAANPLQFVQMKPCNLFRSAQEQLKRAEEVKKVKEIVKEEPEDWQSNLDNWKSGRRKRVEHIIDRVVEAKKLELEEFDRNRKKSKTFSEMMEERESKGRKYSLPVVYNDDVDANDFNGIGYRANDTISGMSSVSEDYENQSVNSDNALDSDKNRFIDGNSNHKESYRRDSESSPGFDDNTSNSTLSAASPDPAYSSSYNSNGSRIQTTTLTSNFSRASVESWAEKHHAPPSSNHLKPKPRLTPKIEGHLASYETKLNDSHADQDERNANVNADKIDLPKIDISSRRELFEKEQRAQFNRSIDTKKPIVLTENAQAPASIKERLSHLEKRNDEPKDVMPTKPNRYSGDFSGVRERFSHGENGQFVTIEPKAPKIDVPVVPLKERLMNLESSMVVTSETPTSNGKLEHRTKKMVEPKAIAFNKPEENNLKVIDNNNESTTSSPIHVDEASHHLKDDEDSGINSDDLQSSLASQQSQPQQVVEEVVIRTKTVTAVMSSPPLSPRSEKPNEPVPAARKPEVMPRRQITPDLVKITSNLNLEDDLLQSQDEIDDEADNSVIDALDIALNAIDTEKPNELINIATSFDEIYEEINEFKPLKATTTSTRGSTIAAPSKEKATAVAVAPVAVGSAKATTTTATAAKTIELSPSIGSSNGSMVETVDEPYYQVPKKQNESYYEVPKSRPIPVYENVDMYYDNMASSHKLSSPTTTKLPVPLEIGTKAAAMQPPKEKPPPPPVESNDEEESECAEEEPLPQDAMKRINSTKRIKKEIRNKRSSFLGIEGNDDESFLELSVAPPPDMAALLQEERRIEKQLYMKAGLYDSSDTAESRDSGVSENHSRQSSEPVTSSSEEQDSNRPEIISALEKDKKLLEAGKNALAMECRVLGTQQWVYNDGFAQNDDDIDPILKALDERERARCIDDQNQEEADILRVERELLQLEQEEMKRKNMMNRKLYEQQRMHAEQQEVELRRSLQDVNGNANLYANVYNNNNNNDDYHLVQPNHRKSMPNLQDMTLREAPEENDRIIPPIPPAKPLRVQEYLKYGKPIYSNGGMIDPRTNQSMPMHLNTIHSNEDFLPYAVNSGGSSNNSINGSYSNMTRHTLHALSAVPKPKFQDTWAHNNNNNNNNYENTNDRSWHSSRDYIDPAAEPYIRPRQIKEPIGDSWLSLQQKRRSDPQNFNYNTHWLIQEAEQRRIDQARRSSTYTNGNEWSQLNNNSNSKVIPRKGSSDNKPLPEAVIQTLTQRVQNKLSDKKRLESQQNHYHYHHHSHQTLGSSTEQLVSPQHNHTNYHQPLQLSNSRLSDEAPREILSVSGKKKCSYCCEELGRGAAMIIESLRLFYHLDCFKCCVCRVQLGDGITGADVRVRNQKLHCNNCFSSDDGVKFSCV
ncbi:uncharacterized protein LOC129577468 isoform X2 [Sitodiplosis mosellana]|nr:uncharacterized protein LOC129577468 isoform X2 [Sitodiplosis mosellana]XP_055320561.1 uncharacterized protein LOC129577468 isoform X2 [Sitodiplosis mosellana]